MTITLAGGGSPTALSAQKRRYSSTAVGFPIRYDLRAFIQGICGVFPSRMRARRAPAYERRVEKCVVLGWEVLPRCLRLADEVHVLSSVSALE